MKYLVAKSYQNFQQIGEEFIINGKTYIQIQVKQNKIKTVRTYSTKEYNKIYSKDKQNTIKPKEKLFVQDIYTSPQKNALGFIDGFITIFKGNTFEYKDWFSTSKARYARTWGWYFISTEPVPADLPIDITPIKLKWELVGNENGTLKPEEEVIKAVEDLIYSDENNKSEYVGSIGDRIEITITVIKAIELETRYGRSTMHIFEDADGNVYVWNTASKSWSEGTVKTIKGSIKDHQTYKGVKQTILTRCLEV